MLLFFYLGSIQKLSLYYSNYNSLGFYFRDYMNKLQFFLCISILMNASIFQAIDIFHAISRGNIKTVNAWVKLNSNLSICNEQGQSVLHAAVLANNKNIVKLLLKSSINVNEIDKKGKTALDYAIDYGYESIVLELGKHKAKVTTEQNAEFVKILLENEPTGLFFSIVKIFVGYGLISLAVFGGTGLVMALAMSLGMGGPTHWGVVIFCGSLLSIGAYIAYTGGSLIFSGCKSAYKNISDWELYHFRALAF